MNSIARLKWLGDTEAFRTRGLNIGDNSFFDSDMWNRFHYKNQNIKFIEELGATILEPYMENLSAYNMAKRKISDPGEEITASALTDFRNRFTVPVGWTFGYVRYGVKAGTTRTIDFNSALTREVKHFRPGGEYFDSGITEESDPKIYSKWEDWYYRPAVRVTLLEPDFANEKLDPIFRVQDTLWGDQKLVYFSQLNNNIDDILYTEGSNWAYNLIYEPVPDRESLLSIRRWMIRSWHEQYPTNDAKMYESSGQGISNALNADQGVFLGLKIPQSVKSMAMDQIRDKFYEFKLFWVSPENDVTYIIRFIFSINMHLTIEFAVEYHGADPVKLRQFSDSPKSSAVLFKNDATGKDGWFGMSIQFVDGRIVLSNIKNEVLAVVNVPKFMTVKREDVTGRKYVGVTGDTTLMQLYGYGACNFIIRPMLYYRNGLVESPEFRSGEKPNVLSTDFTAIIPDVLSGQSVQVTTEIGPNYAQPGMGDQPPSGSKSEREEAFYKFQIAMFGDEAYFDENYLYAIDEQLATVTPIVYDAKVTGPTVPLPGELDTVPAAGVTNTDVISLSFRKGISDSNDFESSNLEISFSLYKDLYTQEEKLSESSVLNRFVNSPFILSLGGLDTIRHDYSADHRGNHSAGSVRENTAITEMGIFLTDRKGRIRSGSNFNDTKLMLSCRDISKKLENAFVLKKRVLDGFSHVEAMQEIVSWANLSARLVVPEDSLAKAVDDPVLPISPYGGRAQWVCNIGDTIFEWMQKIRQFSGWILFIDRFGRIIYKHYDRTKLNRDALAARVKYIFTDKYNWTDTGLITQLQRVIPITEYTMLEFDNYRTRVVVSGINSEPKKKIVDAQQGELVAKVGDRISYQYINSELEKNLGEIRLAAYENKLISTVDGMRKTARSIAKIVFRPKKVVAFTVDIGEQILDLDLFDPIAIYEETKLNIYELVSLNYTVSKNKIKVDIEARNYPI